MSGGGVMWWLPGEHHALVWAGGLALLDGSLDAEVAVRTWEQMTAETDLAAFVTRLAEACGRDPLDLPGFAAAIRSSDGRVNLAARGDFVAAAVAGEEVRVAHGASVTTWLEVAAENGGDVVLRGPVAAGAGEGAAGQPLPLGSGVVAAAEVRSTRLSVDIAAEPSGTPAAVEVPDPVVLVPETDAAPEIEPATEAPATEAPATEAPATEVPAAEVPAAEVPPAEVPAAHEFSHLWGEHTIKEPIENAAVRPVPEAPVAPAGPASEPPAAPAAPEETLFEQLPVPEPTRVPGMPQSAAPPRPVINRVEPPPGQSGFVSSVPKPSGGSASTPQAPASVPAAAPQDPEVLGDHDGHTVIQRPGERMTPVSPGALSDDLLAVLCSRGHANPPQRAQCRVCAEPLDGPSVRVPRPSLGQLVTNVGEVVELVGPIVIGRDPKPVRFHGTEPPRLVVIPHPHVSSNHLELRLEGWSVMAHDLRSTNGTFLRRHGQPPVRLPETPQLVVSGDVLDIGHGVHLTFRELP